MLISRFFRETVKTLSMPRSKATKVSASRRTDPAARDALLTMTSTLMIETGTHDVSLHAIARRADVTAPLLTYHFGSKEGLLLALLERDTAHSFAQLKGLLSMDVDPLTKLRIHIAGVVRTYARHPYMTGLLNQMLRGSEDALSSLVKEKLITPLIAAQRKIIEEGIRAGQLREIDPDQVYFIIVGACQYLSASRVAFRDIMQGKPADPEFIREFESTLIDVLLNGLKA